MRISSCIVLISLVSIAVPISGCQTAGKTVSSKTSTVCPGCKSETKTAALAGLTYTTHTCPGCKTNWKPGPGKGLAGEVHVCDHCKQIVEKCPLCAEKS